MAKEYLDGCVPRIIVVGGVSTLPVAVPVVVPVVMPVVVPVAVPVVVLGAVPVALPLTMLVVVVSAGKEVVIIVCFSPDKLKGGRVLRSSQSFLLENLTVNGRNNIDVQFHGKSTPHHSNTPQYHAQGHWPRPPNLLQQLLSFLPFLHDCLTFKFL